MALIMTYDDYTSLHFKSELLGEIFQYKLILSKQFKLKVELD